MPRFEPIKSLAESCLLNVTRHIDSVWCKHYLDAYKSDARNGRFFHFVVGPFDTVPSKVLVEIIRILKEEKKLRKHHLELLVGPQLRCLDLSRSYDDVSHSVQLAVIRCPELRILNLEGCGKITKQFYQDFLPLLTELQVLNLSETASGDSCLFIIGAYCHKLRELIIRNCPVTDEGIKGLCISKDDLGQPSDRLGQCKNLRKLNMNYTQVTSEGIRAALENMPHLTVLECPNTVQVLADMHQFAVDNMLPDVPKYPLVNLSCTEEAFFLSQPLYQIGSLPTAVHVCPYVLKVEIVTLAGLCDSDLISLTLLERMQELIVAAGEVCAITFDAGILPILQIRGAGLKSLTLAELEGVCAASVAEYCPNLTTLHLVMNRSFIVRTPPAADAAPSPLRKKARAPLAQLNKLESLHLVCVTHMLPSSDIPAQHLPSLLSSQSLVHIYIKECHTLNDNVFRALHAKNNLPLLEHFEIEQCDNLGKATIDLLVASCIQLRILKMWQCKLLTRQNAIDLQKKAAKNRWLLSVDWN